MKRREFLGYSALGALVLSTAGTMGYALSRQLPHSTPPVGLAPTPLGGEPLQPLPRIANLSETAGRFRGALTPAPPMRCRSAMSSRPDCGSTTARWRR